MEEIILRLPLLLLFSAVDKIFQPQRIGEAELTAEFFN
jgi:hypothetical protein